ncbi:MAG TPA: PAS domain S-box protein [Gemmataceae bacterium]|jgi:PAS domain S-box-containing protein
MSSAPSDRNLLFGVLALQADLIDAPRFIEACLLWTTRKQEHLADLLVERGWIEPADKAHVEYLLERKLQKLGGNARTSLAALPDDIKRSLAALPDDDIQRSLADGPLPVESQLATIAHVPTQAERYCRLRLHATGGIGRVWLAHDSDLGRDVALKELRPERAEHAAYGARFLQEARITGQLEHPGIIPVYELIRPRDGQQPFYTMRFVKGRTLSEAARAYHDKRLAGQADALELPVLLNAFVTVCNTVAYAHSRGVIHRDLKGQNVILGDFGEVVVLDWGLAKRVGRPEGETVAPAVVVEEAGADSGYTVQGQALGTPAYMAPEQADGRLDLIDRRTDVYGLGAILYEILTGTPPFTGRSTEEVLRKVREEEPLPPHSLWPDAPPALEDLCLRALSKRPEDRPAAAVELAQEVQGWQEFERRKAEEALRESEALYHSLVESLPCNVFRKDLEGRFTFANQRFCELVGLPLEQILGKTNFDFTPPPFAEKYRRDDQKVLETGTLLEDIEELPSQRYGHVLKTVVRDARGKITGLQGISWDVTERKLAEEELRKSRERFELVVQGSQDGLWDWNLTTGEVYYSPRYKAMLGYEDHEFPNRSEEWEKRIHPDDLERVKSELRAHFEGRESLSWIEFRFRHKDGSYRWIRSRAYVLRDANGRVYRMAGSHEDITDRKNAEAELAQERHLLHTLMDNLPDAIFFTDTAPRAIRVNKALTDLLGLDDPAQAVGKTYFDIFPEDVARQVTEEHEEIIRTGRPIVASEGLAPLPDGRMIWFSTTKMPFRDRDGNIIGIVGVARDITQRKQEEMALRESEERYRSVIAAMQDGIVLLDADGSIRACNASAERILGLPADQMLGRTPLDPRWGAIREDGTPLPDEDRPPVVTLRTGQPCANAVMGVRRPDGTVSWLSVNTQPLFHADGTTLAGVVACFADITDRRRIEETLRLTTLELTRLQRQLGNDGTTGSSPGVLS